MDLTLVGHEERYAVEQLLLALFPEGGLPKALVKLSRGKTWLTARTELSLDGRRSWAVKRLPLEEETVRSRRRVLQQSVYHAALPLLEQPPVWGALAGVRPTKITTRHLLEGGTPKTADKLLKDVYYVEKERRALAVDCSLATVHAVEKLQPEDVSLYIGIPFCPTRCSYCSFVSRTVGKKTELLEPYLDALSRELEVTGQLLSKSGRQVRTVYIGGGTPTTLSAGQMERLLSQIHSAFDLTRCLEFTVEGGRPDTLDAGKLQTIACGGANRMSINPQTMNDRVLRACGRPHRGADVLRAYGEARQAGFDAINMDLIAGLPEDSLDSFRESLNAVAQLRPENITVHTLALKKGADLFERRGSLPPVEEVSRMVAFSQETLRDLGYVPYYLYRQKYMSGSFENVGWSLPGKECLYNIYMMEEIHTILSLGGGGMNKVNLPNGRLTRFHNPKFPEQYIEMLPGVLEQKKELFALMEGTK